MKYQLILLCRNFKMQYVRYTWVDNSLHIFLLFQQSHINDTSCHASTGGGEPDKVSFTMWLLDGRVVSMDFIPESRKEKALFKNHHAFRIGCDSTSCRIIICPKMEHKHWSRHKLAKEIKNGTKKKTKNTVRKNPRA